MALGTMNEKLRNEQIVDREIHNTMTESTNNKFVEKNG